MPAREPKREPQERRGIVEARGERFAGTERGTERIEGPSWAEAAVSRSEPRRHGTACHGADGARECRNGTAPGRRRRRARKRATDRMSHDRGRLPRPSAPRGDRGLCQTDGDRRYCTLRGHGGRAAIVAPGRETGSRAGPVSRNGTRHDRPPSKRSASLRQRATKSSSGVVAGTGAQATTSAEHRAFADLRPGLGHRRCLVFPRGRGDAGSPTSTGTRPSRLAVERTVRRGAALDSRHHAGPRLRSESSGRRPLARENASARSRRKAGAMAEPPRGAEDVRAESGRSEGPSEARGRPHPARQREARWPSAERQGGLGRSRRRPGREARVGFPRPTPTESFSRGGKRHAPPPLRSPPWPIPSPHTEELPPPDRAEVPELGRLDDGAGQAKTRSRIEARGSAPARRATPGRPGAAPADTLGETRQRGSETVAFAARVAEAGDVLERPDAGRSEVSPEPGSGGEPCRCVGREWPGQERDRSRDGGIRTIASVPGQDRVRAPRRKGGRGGRSTVVRTRGIVRTPGTGRGGCAGRPASRPVAGGPPALGSSTG